MTIHPRYAKRNHPCQYGWKPPAVKLCCNLQPGHLMLSRPWFQTCLFSPPKNLTDIFQMSWNQQLVMRPRIIWLNWMIHPSKRLSFQKIWWKLHPDVKSHGVKGPGCFWLTVGPPVFRVFVGGFLKERFLMGKSGKYVEENPDMCYIGLRTSSYLRGLK